MAPRGRSSISPTSASRGRTSLYARPRAGSGARGLRRDRLWRLGGAALVGAMVVGVAALVARGVAVVHVVLLDEPVGKQRDREHLVHPLDEVELHVLLHLVGHVAQVLLVRLRHDDLAEPGTVRREHLLLHT